MSHERINRGGWPMVRVFQKILMIVLGLMAIVSSLAVVATPLFRPDEAEARVEQFKAVATSFAGQDDFQVSRANRFVHSITTHSVDRKVMLRENWVQWCLGHVYPPLLRSQNALRIVEGGIGDCSERVAVLQWIARQSQCPTRIVGLGGHVVLEVFSKGKWVAADPDYGVTFSTDVQTLTHGGAKYVAWQLQRAGVDAPTIENYLSILQSAGDNVSMGLNEPLSPRLKVLEDWCEIARVAFPWFFFGLLLVVPMAWPGERRVQALPSL
ncbi:MAG: hypothetical protein ACK5O8_05170 [Pirellula sp.]